MSVSAFRRSSFGLRGNGWPPVAAPKSVVSLAGAVSAHVAGDPSGGLASLQSLLSSARDQQNQSPTWQTAQQDASRKENSLFGTMSKEDAARQNEPVKEPRTRNDAQEKTGVFGSAEEKKGALWLLNQSASRPEAPWWREDEQGGLIARPKEETADNEDPLQAEECETCNQRKYQDGSDDPGVSFKNPTAIAPELAASAVRGHESEHVFRERYEAEMEQRRVIYQAVTLHNAICPECGRIYVSGGTTRTVTKANQASQAGRFRIGFAGQRQLDSVA